MKAALLRALVCGSVATAVWSGAWFALGDFSTIGTIAFGLATAGFFAVLPLLMRSANRSATPS